MKLNYETEKIPSKYEINTGELAYNVPDDTLYTKTIQNEIITINNTESGSNEYGNWIKYSNGFMIQYGTITHNMNTDLFQNWYFPLAFKTTNISLSTSFSDTASSGTDNDWWNNIHLITILRGSSNNFRTLSRTLIAVTGEIYWTAIGK